MNKKLVFNTIGNILKIDSLFLVLPLIISIIYKDSCYLSFTIPMIAILIIGFALTVFIKPDKKEMSLIDGFSIVGLSWVLICVLGTVPYLLSGSITSFVDSFFETTSGFTTTGATILSGKEIEALPKSIQFYRVLTHFIGGIGVLVFVLAVLPDSGAKAISILKAETTGPQAGKLVSKVSSTAKILCLIYILLTLLESILLVFDKGINYFDAICLSFSTAGTGGFANYASSCADLSNYAQVVVAVFMFIFGINFNIFFMIIIGKSFKALKNEELITYIIIMVSSTILITSNLLISASEIYNNFGLAIKDAFFESSSFMTSTGLSNVKYDNWPSFSKSLLFLLMFIGACAGSTGGGLKVTRVVILFKSFIHEIKKIFHPRRVHTITLDKEPIDEDVVKGTLTYSLSILLITIISVILVSFDGFDFETNISAVACSINNLGIGFGDVLNSSDAFCAFSPLSKIVLTIVMLIGRLELYPILIILAPKSWIKNN